MVGHNVSHAKNRTRKVFKPNLHSARIWMGTGFRKMKLCTKCQRLLKNLPAGKAGKSVLSITNKISTEVSQIVTA